MLIELEPGPWRERADDPAALAPLIEQHLLELPALREAAQKDAQGDGERADLGRLLGKLGRNLRLVGRTQEALEAQEEAAQIWHDLEREKAEFLARLYCAVLQGERGDDAATHDAFARLHERVRQDDAFAVYEDFLLEYHARFLAERQQLDAARTHMARALALRTRRGNAGQIAQTRALIQLLNA